MARIKETMISQTLVKELLCYDRDTGQFRHRITYGGQKAGDIAGSVDCIGYVVLSILGYTFKAHRVAWLYEHGVWPEGHIDHANGDTAYNAIANLRPATASQNKANEKLRGDNSCGFKGVRFHKPNNAWQARIGKDGKRLSLGYYSSPGEAHAAYMRAANVMFGEFARAS